MLEEKTFQERKRQIEMCTHLDEYVNGAKTMLMMKKHFNLKGDFSNMTSILESVSKSNLAILSVKNL